MMERITFTGDPFVDAGRLAMETLRQKTLEEKMRFATDVYVDRWEGKLNAVFLHSKITHISRKGKPDLQRKETLDYYLGALKGEGAASKGRCRICASEGLLFQAGRDNYPLVGSGDFVNFHHFHESGLLICKDCLIKLYFLPLAILQGRKLMLLHIQNEYMAELWREKVVWANLDKVSKGTSESILKSTYTNPMNALFYFASEMIMKSANLPSQQMRLFCFSNFATKPDVEIYDLPRSVFGFLKSVLKPHLRPDWLSFVKRHYRFRKSIQFDKASEEWVETKRGTTAKLDAQDYEGTHTNTIYENLLSGKSILGHLRRFHKDRKLPITIAITYVKEVRKMRDEQIEFIQQISDKIIALSEKAGSFKKFLTPLEGARRAYELRAAIIRMAKTHFKNGKPEPFVRLKDYVEYLFPDSQNWYEVRDLLLICLYEKLHDKRVQPSDISDETVAHAADTEGRSLEKLNQ